MSGSTIWHIGRGLGRAASDRHAALRHLNRLQREFWAGYRQGINDRDRQSYTILPLRKRQ